MRAGSPPRTSGIVRSIFSTSSRTIPSPARPPAYERLVGDLAGCYSRRINIQHRLVYEVFPEERIVLVLRMWTHYE